MKRVTALLLVSVVCLIGAAAFSQTEAQDDGQLPDWEFFEGVWVYQADANTEYVATISYEDIHMRGCCLRLVMSVVADSKVGPISVQVSSHHLTLYALNGRADYAISDSSNYNTYPQFGGVYILERQYPDPEENDPLLPDSQRGDFLLLRIFHGQEESPMDAGNTVTEYLLMRRVEE